ncbi:unnamed protein product [Rotaria magnacalcarata]|uniref:histone deacetylase n=1 Tax=Rotaria magnacalcarata TaxID=392030 RepID=A0A814KT75_9BILA|nr:unnamed protein product [Rotaria magnacalcarata]CAF1633810.1 unnamed protein product [Rotaria magnacalcarata]CAF1908688.1 unnamed protein product [Rotaria magnacalcarata]CAF3764690.1 unnamed protein product [Rotaria magnacalcarata]CAF3801178.1 unnamed protein product [Rotaria magnacalcarata]
MVDFCRLSTLPNDNSFGSGNSNTNTTKDSGSTFFPTVFLPYSHLIDPDRHESVAAALFSATTAATLTASGMEQSRLEEEKLRVHAKDKKNQSANASAEVKTHLKSFICRKLQKEGKLGNQDSNDMLRRFQSEPVLANPRLESGNLKIRSDLRQRILSQHKQVTPMSDRRHPIRSTNLAQKQQPTENEFALVPPMSLIPFTSQSTQLHHPEQLWPDFPRSVYGCYSTGNLGENAIQLCLGVTATNENSLHTNILGPKHFIVEEENEALLAKELQEAKIQSSHNSHSSMHSSQPHLLNFESNDFCIRNPNLSLDRLATHSKSLSSLSIFASSTEKKVQRSLSGTIRMRFTTGLAYDDDTLKHECYCKRTDLHLENPRRLLVIYERLKKLHLLDACEIIRGYCATIDMLTDCHDPGHVYLFGCDQRQRSQQSPAIFTQRINYLVPLPCGGCGIHDDTDTIWNDEYTARACRLSIGNTIELTKYVIDGTLKNGFALVRPPGHHATQKPLGFCYFNTVAITAKYLKKYRNINRIAIVDWDIHHGNGTQDLTYDDPNILYISLHRYDNGTYFPGGGRLQECGCDDGLGKNVNIAFSSDPQSVMTDVEYLAAFRSVVMPILEQFQPQIILVSCGFDACIGHPHPLGGYELTPTCFAYMTRKLMSLADGKVVLVLEGGYELNALAECGKLCVEALLDLPIPNFSKETLEAHPNPYAVNSLKQVIEIQREFWPSIEQYKHLISMPHAKTIDL